MANGIKIGNLDISAFKVGSGDCKVYLGDTLLYSGGTQPTPSYMFTATYSGGTTYSAECDSSSGLTTATTKPSGYEYTAMTDAVIGDCITSIDTEAFKWCESLTSVTIPDSVTTIGQDAFARCYSLSSVTIPSGVTSIGNYAFFLCEMITSINIPSGVTSIGNYAFSSCNGLTSIDIPDSVTSIGDYAFSDDQMLRSCTIGSGVTNIGNGAFEYCSYLSGITVNATTPPTLGNSAFNNTNDCPIYVPSGSVSTYQSASGWSSYSSRIFAIPSPTPSGYTDVEYVQCGDGTNGGGLQLLTNVTADYYVEVESQLTTIVSPHSPTIIGEKSSTEAVAYQFGLCYYSGDMFFDYGGGRMNTSINFGTQEQKHTYGAGYISGSSYPTLVGVTVDGVVNSTNDATISVEGLPYLVGGDISYSGHSASDVQVANNGNSMKIYSVKIYTDYGDTLVGDYIPVIDQNNVVTLYDTVSGNYATPYGTLIAGNPINS